MKLQDKCHKSFALVGKGGKFKCMVRITSKIKFIDIELSFCGGVNFQDLLVCMCLFPTDVVPTVVGRC